MKQVIRPAARDDIIRQFRYYLVDQDAPEVANRFLEAVEAAIEEIARMPGMGAAKHLVNEALAGLRSWHVQGFEHIRLYYLVQEDTIRVIRVLHGKRDIQRILEREQPEDETRH